MGGPQPITAQQLHNRWAQIKDTHLTAIPKTDLKLKSRGGYKKRLRKERRLLKDIQNGAKNRTFGKNFTTQLEAERALAEVKKELKSKYQQRKPEVWKTIEEVKSFAYGELVEQRQERRNRGEPKCSQRQQQQQQQHFTK